MKAEDFIKRGPICVKPGVSLEEAAKILAQYDIGLVIVSPDCRREIAGVLTERDIVRSPAGYLSLLRSTTS